MNTKIKLSYCIPVWNEYAELSRLLTHITPFLEDCDEIIVQGDQGKVTSEVVSVLSRYIDTPNFKYIEYPLNREFDIFKNNISKSASGDYIVLIDADELPSKGFLTTIKYILHESPEIDAFDIPRFNIVNGLENTDWAKTWGWSVVQKPVEKLDYDTKDILETYSLQTQTVPLVNLPDYQRRVYRNNPNNIKWQGSVHERLVGVNILAKLPFDDFNYGFWHIKELTRQISQNNFYNML